MGGSARSRSESAARPRFYGKTCDRDRVADPGEGASELLVEAPLQRHPHGRAQAAHGGLAERDVAAVAAGDVAGDGKTEACVARVLVAAVAEAVERAEHILALRRRDARSVVVHVDAHPLLVGAGADHDV